MERQQLQRQQMLLERQQQEERQRKEEQRRRQQQQQQQQLPSEPEPHWVRKVHELSKISHLFPLTMAPPAGVTLVRVCVCVCVTH